MQLFQSSLLFGLQSFGTPKCIYQVTKARTLAQSGALPHAGPHSTNYAPLVVPIVLQNGCFGVLCTMWAKPGGADKFRF